MSRVIHCWCLTSKTRVAVSISVYSSSLPPPPSPYFIRNSTGKHETKTRMHFEITPPQRKLEELNPNLMPFHIAYDGKAPISTYFHIESASERVGAPEDAPDASNGPIPVPGSSKTKKRFLSSFRGRTLHGLQFDLPEGYTGLVLDSAEGSKAVAPAVPPRRKSSVKDRIRSIGSGVRRRTQRGKRQQDSDMDEDNEDENAEQEAEEQMQVDPALLKTLVPTGQFNSFTIWNADIPVDDGDDVYARSLTEWLKIADAVSTLNCPRAHAF
jgi:hypothetical protein